MQIDRLNRVAPVEDKVITPFPGISAEFVLKSGDWKLYESTTECVRHLEFESVTPGSFLKGMVVRGFRDRHVEIGVEFHPASDKMARSYFGDHGLFQCGFEMCSAFGPDLKKLFAIVIQNNTLPDEYISLITPLVETGEWQLEKEEETPSELKPIEDFGILDLRKIC